MFTEFEYEGEAYLYPDNEKVNVSGQFEVIEWIPYEPANYAWDRGWDVAQGDEEYFISESDLMTYQGKCCDCLTVHKDDVCPLDQAEMEIPSVISPFVKI
jgi:hypothetical protein